MAMTTKIVGWKSERRAWSEARRVSTAPRIGLLPDGTLVAFGDDILRVNGDVDRVVYGRTGCAWVSQRHADETGETCSVSEHGSDDEMVVHAG